MNTSNKNKIETAESVFGKSLNQIRRDAKLGNKQIAIALGFKSDSMVSHFHAGRHIPSKDDLHKIRRLLPSQELKARLDEAVATYFLSWSSVTGRSDSHESQIQTVSDLIESGYTARAIIIANEFREKSLDVEFRTLMEDLLAEMYFRTGQYHKAIELAQSIREDMRGRPLAREIRSGGLLGIVLRSTNAQKHVERAYIEISNALETFQSNREVFTGIPDIQDWYELMLVTERVLVKLSLSKGDEKRRVAKAARIYFEARLQAGCTFREKMECIDMIGRCSILLSDPSHVNDVLTEIRNHTELPRSFQERFLILEGKMNLLLNRFEEANLCFEKAYQKSVAWNNEHHARIASGLILSLKLT